MMSGQVGALLYPSLRALQIYGANTAVGKSVFSSLLCAALAPKHGVYYIKPVSTGPLAEADDRHISRFVPSVKTQCLYQFAEPVSPHIAARSSSSDVCRPTIRPLSSRLHPLTNQQISDNAIRASLRNALLSISSRNAPGVAIVETAGAVLSPTPSGSLQADLYRPFRLPTFLVGDSRLGGIGSTISAFESLHVRGYDVECIALFANDRYENHTYLRDYFKERDVHVFSVAEPPERNASEEDDANLMQAYYDEVSQQQEVSDFTARFLENHDRRIQGLSHLPAKALESVWWPFAQHKHLSKDNIVAIDSAHGDHFQIHSKSQQEDQSLLISAFDGSASWWTQGLGHGNPHLALTAAHAAGRYGHVMFANAIHEPALALSQKLVNGMGNKRLQKVFYSDDGSTGVEVAVKMALRSSSLRYGFSAADDVLVLGLTNSYHGDTIGTMDCSEPSVFNKKVDWYRGRGSFFQFPDVKMRRGKWIVEPPQGLAGILGEPREFSDLDEVFDFNARSEDRALYDEYFDSELQRLQADGKKFGALILEPLLLGAGGMMFSCPLYQSRLVAAVRRMDEERKERAEENDYDWRGMPVIFDEVFTGLYRLGRFSAASFLGVEPDIVVNAKLLTGGLLPLATTTASQAVFDTFLSDDKSDALLHGHSYTAHAMGCAVANESLRTMAKIDTDGSWDAYRADWRAKGTMPPGQPEKAWSMWSHSFVVAVSHKEEVDSVFALGSVLAISLKDSAGGGYTSTAAATLQKSLLERNGSGDDSVVHSRVLGNVLYLMAAMTTSPGTLSEVEGKVLARLR